MKNILLTIYLATTVIIGYKIFPMLGLLNLIWMLIGLFSIKYNKLQNINKTNKILFHTFLVFYPLIELIIKYMLVYNVIPYSWNALNRIEHLAFSVGIVIISYPALKKTLDKLNFFESLIFMVSFISLFGIFNEIVEYIIRVKWGHTSTGHFAAYYWDTIYDLAINFIGSTTGYMLLHINNLKSIISKS